MTNTLRKIISAASATVLLMSLSVQSFALIEGVRIDNFTGEEIGGVTEGVYALSGDTTYDHDTGLYRYKVNNKLGSYVYSTVPDGATVQQTVILDVPNEVMPQLYCDGELVEEPDFSCITEPGGYTLMVDDGSDVNSPFFTFRILDDYTSLFSSFVPPDDFEITYATLDGSYIDYTSSGVYITEDGRYNIVYSCPSTGQSFSINFYSDRTAPALEFEGLINNRYAQGPVTVTGLGEGEEVYMTIDGYESVYSDVLARAGHYKLKVTDRAGNYTNYDFTIRQYLSNITWILILAVTAIFAIILFYSIFKRKKFRSN